MRKCHHKGMSPQMDHIIRMLTSSVGRESERQEKGVLYLKFTRTANLHVRYHYGSDWKLLTVAVAGS